MRTTLTITQVRPIKKMFIIEEGDYAAFEHIFIEIQDEIDSIFNLIFVNDSDLWSETNFEFVKRNDPDMILNYSKAEEDKLSNHFRIEAIKVTADYKISRLGTLLSSFTKQPDILKNYTFRDKKEKCFTASAIKNNSLSLTACINYGMLTKAERKNMNSFIFKNKTFVKLNNKEDIIYNIFANRMKFNNICTEIGNYGMRGFSTSIWEINYNEIGVFEDKRKYFFVSDKNDFKSISYFWNIRSYYMYANFAWLPVEFIDEIPDIIEIVVVCFKEDILKNISSKYSKASVLKIERLFFKGHNKRWSCFENERIASIENNEIIIHHPAQKSFSDNGFGGAFVLDVKGIKEIIYPRMRNLGEIFINKNFLDTINPERFNRISEHGFSKYMFDLDILQSNDSIFSLYLPAFDQVILHIFEDAGYKIENTDKNAILSRTIDLLGGINEIDLVCNETIYKLFRDLTATQRSKQIAKELKPLISIEIKKGDLNNILSQLQDKGLMNLEPIIQSVENLFNRIEKPKLGLNDFFKVIQQLYNRGVFLRGKYFKCPFCENNIWIGLENIIKKNQCPDCSKPIDIPLSIVDEQSTDFFKLNQLIIRSIDQGQISTILLLNYFLKQKPYSFEFKSNFIVYNTGTKQEIDLIIKVGKRIGIAECKSEGKFTHNQIDTTLEFSSIIKCAFVIFSSTNPSDSVEVKETETYLKTKNLDIPAFIICKDALFDPETKPIYKYFELRNNQKLFTVGPIVI